MQYLQAGSDPKIVGNLALKIEIEPVNLRLGAVHELSRRRLRYGHLDVCIVVVECRRIDPKPMVNEIAFDADFVSVKHLWMHRRCGRWERVIDAGFKTAIVRDVAYQVIGEVMVEREPPGRLLEDLVRVARNHYWRDLRRRFKIDDFVTVQIAPFDRIAQTEGDVGVSQAWHGRRRLAINRA